MAMTTRSELSSAMNCFMPWRGMYPVGEELPLVEGGLRMALSYFYVSAVIHVMVNARETLVADGRGRSVRAPARGRSLLVPSRGRVISRR